MKCIKVIKASFINELEEGGRHTHCKQPHAKTLFSFHFDRVAERNGEKHTVHKPINFIRTTRKMARRKNWLLWKLLCEENKF
jgi:hypothetical protein